MDEHMLNHHMIDEVGLLMKYNKDLSQSEAEAVIEANRKAMEDEHLQEMKEEPAEEPVVEEYDA